MAIRGAAGLASESACMSSMSSSDVRASCMGLFARCPSARCSPQTISMARRLEHSRQTGRIRAVRRPLPSSSVRLGAPHRRWRRRAATSEEGVRGSSEGESGSSSTSTISRDSAAESSQGEGHPHDASGSTSAGSGSPQEGEKKETKDVLALRSLDAYFDKLKGPEKEVEKAKEPQVVSAEASVATGSGEAKAEATEKDNKDAGGKLKEDEEELLALFKSIMDASARKKAQGQSPGKEQAEEGKDLQDVQFQITVGLPSEYQRWVDAQQAMNPPTALNILLAINVAVFLFELASPEAVPGLIVTSLPSLLGAKVNALISAGEWWRLITPMFLHAGFFHILLGSVVLLSLGTSVEVAFGSLGFFGAYLTGGVFGNLMSYLQTADVTVGGTGPIYGLVGAYLVYLYRNREAIGTEEADGSLWSLIFFAALNVAIGSALPIDDWTHIGAALGGLVYGALVCPKLQRTSIGFSKLQDVLKAEMTKALGQEQAPSSSDNGGDGTSGPEQEIEPGGTLFLLEKPDAKRQAWALAACLGLAALLLQLSTAAIPASLLDISSQINV